MEIRSKYFVQIKNEFELNVFGHAYRSSNCIHVNFIHIYTLYMLGQKNINKNKQFSNKGPNVSTKKSFKYTRERNLNFVF